MAATRWRRSVRMPVSASNVTRRTGHPRAGRPAVAVTAGYPWRLEGDTPTASRATKPTIRGRRHRTARAVTAGMRPERWPGPRRSIEAVTAATSHTTLHVRHPARNVTAPRSHKRPGRGTSARSATIRTKPPATGGDVASSATAGRPQQSGDGAPRIRTVRSATSRMALLRPRVGPATAGSRGRTRSGGIASAASAMTLTRAGLPRAPTALAVTGTGATTTRTPAIARAAIRSVESNRVDAANGAGLAARNQAGRFSSGAGDPWPRRWPSRGRCRWRGTATRWGRKWASTRTSRPAR